MTSMPAKRMPFSRKTGPTRRAMCRSCATKIIASGDARQGVGNGFAVYQQDALVAFADGLYVRLGDGRALPVVGDSFKGYVEVGVVCRGLENGSPAHAIHWLDDGLAVVEDKLLEKARVA